MVFRGFGKRRHAPEIEARIPPGQTLTEKWPILTYGRVPPLQSANLGLPRHRIGRSGAPLDV